MLKGRNLWDPLFKTRPEACSSPEAGTWARARRSKARGPSQRSAGRRGGRGARRRRGRARLERHARGVEVGAQLDGEHLLARPAGHQARLRAPHHARRHPHAHLRAARAPRRPQAAPRSPCVPGAAGRGHRRRETGVGAGRGARNPGSKPYSAPRGGVPPRLQIALQARQVAPVDRAERLPRAGRQPAGRQRGGAQHVRRARAQRGVHARRRRRRRPLHHLRAAPHLAQRVDLARAAARVSADAATSTLTLK